MSLPASGSISFSQVNVELGFLPTATISLDQASLRSLAGVASGAVSMQNLRGKSNAFAFTIANNQTNANLATLATNAGWDGIRKLVATINSGVLISANSTGASGLTVSGSYPGGVELINNGTIAGMGGAGGRGNSGSGAGVAGAAGGRALLVSSLLTFRNNGTVAGGGGGGGGAGFALGPPGPPFFNQATQIGGGGGGGGRTGATNSAGGVAGDSTQGTAGAGAQGTSSSAGAGGPGAQSGDPRGGGGGAYGAAGAAGASATSGGGAGGAAGAAISGNSNITYLATGTRLGAIT